MPISPTDFLSVATQLQGGGPVAAGEPRDRTVIGRYYYTAYLMVRKAIRDRAKLPSMRCGHEDLYTALSKHPGEPEVQEIGVALANLCTMRQRADYELHEHIDKNTVALVKANVDIIVRTLPTARNRLPTSIPRLKRP